MQQMLKRNLITPEGIFVILQKGNNLNKRKIHLMEFDEFLLPVQILRACAVV